MKGEFYRFLHCRGSESRVLIRKRISHIEIILKWFELTNDLEILLNTMEFAIAEINEEMEDFESIYLYNSFSKVLDYKSYFDESTNFLHITIKNGENFDRIIKCSSSTFSIFAEFVLHEQYYYIPRDFLINIFNDKEVIAYAFGTNTEGYPIYKDKPKFKKCENYGYLSLINRKIFQTIPKDKFLFKYLQLDIEYMIKPKSILQRKDLTIYSDGIGGNGEKAIIELEEV